jgi:Dolichyl-phosphate-mannose-protein mannosyltransferase
MAAPARATLAHTSTRLGINRRHATPIVLFLGALLLYLTTLTHVHTFDALSYVTSVERKPWTEVFHPHHLAYGPLGALALALGRALGYTGGAALPLQLVNAAAGAAGVALFFSIARRVTCRPDLGLAAALLLGMAYAYWYYAVEIEVYTVATLFLLICLRLLVELIERPTRRGMLLLGIAQGGAVLLHQTNALFCAPVLITFLVTNGDRLLIKGGQDEAACQERVVVQHLLAYILPLALTVGLPYLFVGLVVSGFRNWGEFAAWLTEYARTGWWGGPITTQKWVDLGVGVTGTLAQPGGTLLWLLLAGLLVLHLRRLCSSTRPLVIGLATWLLVYGAFFLWWEPDNVEFWIASLPPVLLLLALALRGARRWGPEVWVALTVAATALGVNYDAITRRGDAAMDLQRRIASELGAHSRPADLLLVPDGLLELYLPYYEHHDNFLSLNQALFDANENWGQACAAVRERVDVVLHAGAAALIADEVLRPPDLLLRRHRLARPEVDACFAPYQDALQPLVLGADLPGYWRLPTSEDLAKGEGWRFGRFGEGWRAANVTNEHFEGGWRFVPGIDPSLTSPLLELDARRYAAIEIRLANATRARDAQLFFAGPDGRIDEARSVHWTLKPTSGVETYRIDLEGQPGWEGTITRLRLDPVGVGDGGEVRVEWMRLLSAD